MNFNHSFDLEESIFVKIAEHKDLFNFIVINFNVGIIKENFKGFIIRVFINIIFKCFLKEYWQDFVMYSS